MPNKKTKKSVKTAKPAKQRDQMPQKSFSSPRKSSYPKNAKSSYLLSAGPELQEGSPLTGSFEDMEGLLLGWFSSKGNAKAAPKLLLPDSFYCSTPVLSEFSQKYGFHIGERAFSISRGKGIGMLLNLLESSGLGKLLYMPSIDRVIIRSAASQSTKLRLGFNVHAYEAGIIAGFLSSHASKNITAAEVSCVYNGSDACQFVSIVTEGEPSAGNQRKPNLGTKFIRESVKISGAQDKTEGEIHFTMLGMLPFIAEAPLESASKLMFLAGIEAAAGYKENYQEGLRRMASFLCMDIAGMGRKGTKREVSIHFGAEVSSSGFMELGTKAFIGFLSKHFNSSVTLSKRKAKEGHVIAMTFEGV